MRKLEGKLFLPHRNNIGNQNKTKPKKKEGRVEWGDAGSWVRWIYFGKVRNSFFQTFLGMTLLFLCYRVSRGWVKDDRKTFVVEVYKGRGT
jgi:hypothetical protein